MLRLGRFGEARPAVPRSHLQREMEAFLLAALPQVPVPLRIALQSVSKALTSEQISGVLDEVKVWVTKMEQARERDLGEARGNHAGTD